MVILEVSLDGADTDRIADEMLSGVMYILRTSTSVFWGYPKSRISSDNPSQCLSILFVVFLTIQQLIDQNKIVLDRILVKLAKVLSPQRDEAIQKLKDNARVGIALGNCHNVDVLVLHVAKRRRPEREDR